VIIYKKNIIILYHPMEVVFGFVIKRVL